MKEKIIKIIEEMQKHIGTREGFGETASWNKGRFEALEDLKSKLSDTISYLQNEITKLK